MSRRFSPAFSTACTSIGASLALTAGAVVAVSLGPVAAPAAGAPPASVEPAGQPVTAAATTAQQRRPVRFGGTVFERSGESYREAFLRVRRTYGGRLGAVRMFFPGLPGAWSTIRSQVGKTPVVVSFKAPPSEIIAGRHDARLRTWFRQAPENRPTRWSYWHEPEDDHERGQLNPAAYRDAWRHIHRLEKQAHNRRLRSTLILMCWTLEKNSGRQWRTYYPGDAAIDVMAYDCYNAGHKANRYRRPADLLHDAARVSRQTGTPWGVAELGSVVVRGDNGAGRGRWLRNTAQFAREHGARFVTYFDSDVGTDYRLHDSHSRGAWRRVVSSQW